MALLTAEDVLNKAFSKTKYREGFDQDEVDDFLDEIAHTISSLMAERDDLANRLQAAQSAAAAQSASGGSPASAEEPVVSPYSEPAVAAPAPAYETPAPQAEPPSPTGMLAMAQKLHDEYVSSAEEEKERIVSSAEVEKERIVSEAKSKAESIVEQAQNDAKARLAALDHDRSDLERKIDDLRRFERDYRSRLTTYLENLLGDLDHGAGKDRAPGTAATP